MPRTRHTTTPFSLTPTGKPLPSGCIRTTHTTPPQYTTAHIAAPHSLAPHTNRTPQHLHPMYHSTSCTTRSQSTVPLPSAYSWIEKCFHPQKYSFHTAGSWLHHRRSLHCAPPYLSAFSSHSVVFPPCPNPRPTRRHVGNYKSREFTFTSHHDGNGIIFFMGLNRKEGRWYNPVDTRVRPGPVVRLMPLLLMPLPPPPR